MFEQPNNKIVRYKHQQLLKSYYGFNIDEVSHKNLQSIRQSIQRLTTSEKIIFEKLIHAYTLKHATNAADEILETGKICSVRALENKGITVESHSSGKKGYDQSAFFVLGLGEHKTPIFIASASHEVTIDLSQLFITNPDMGRRLWVSTHLSEFISERAYIYDIGDVSLKIQHHENKTKSYTVTRDHEVIHAFQVNYQDEIFSGYDVVAGISFKFIYLLRLLGGKANPAIDNLYAAAEENSDQFIPLLEAFFSSLMPGNVYPEAKIIKEITLHPTYFQIKKREDIPKPQGQDYYSDPLCTNLKNKIMLAAGSEGSASELDFLLSQKIPHSKSSSIYLRPSVNEEILYTNERYNLIYIVCMNLSETTEKLGVLQRHGADFRTKGHYHYLAALSTNYEKEEPNTAAFNFLKELGVKPVSNEPTYNQTPLMLACKLKRIDFIQYFVETAGVDINEPLRFRHESRHGGISYNDPTNGKTALDFAIESNDESIIAYLKNKGARSGLSLSLPKEKKGVCVAVMLTGIRADKKPYVILGKKRNTKKNKHLDNVYCFPGGEVDDSDQSFEHAAIRELFEETTVDVNQIPTAKISHLATIDGFKDYFHNTTIFYLIDIGAHPINVVPNDDLVEARRITLDKIILKDASVANFMTVDNSRVLGSNALLIQHCLIKKQMDLSVNQFGIIKEQCLIEEHGHLELCDLIIDNKEDIYPGSKTWQKIEYLLENRAHFSYKYIPSQSLALLMLDAHSFEGLTLLKQHQIDLTYPDQIKTPGDPFYGTVLGYALKKKDLHLAEKLLALEPGLLNKSIDSNIELIYACVDNNFYQGIDYLINLGVNPNLFVETEDVERLPIISYAIKYASMDIFKALIGDHRILINQQCTKREGTPLMVAIKYNKKEMAWMLLEKFQFDLFVKNEYGKTALMMTNKKSEWEDFASFVAKLMSPEAVNPMLITPRGVSTEVIEPLNKVDSLESSIGRDSFFSIKPNDQASSSIPKKLQK